MRRRRTVIVVAALPVWACLAASCHNNRDAPLSQPLSTSSVSGGATDGTSGDVACTYTDPAATAISVHRALSCADGTRVWVRGVVVQMADGTRWICDADVAGSATECSAAGLKILGGDVGDAIELTGVKTGATLVVGAGLPPPPGNTIGTFSVLAVPPST